MIKFEINTNGILSIKEKKKDFYEMIFGGIVFYILLLVASKYTIASEGFFIFLAIFLTLLYIFIFIIIPISLIMRINKVVRQIHVDDNKIWLSLNNKYSFQSTEIKSQFVKDKFTGFGKRNKDGILVTNAEGKEYWIIEDFFNDYDEIAFLFSNKWDTVPQIQ